MRHANTFDATTLVIPDSVFRTVNEDDWKQRVDEAIGRVYEMPGDQPWFPSLAAWDADGNMVLSVDTSTLILSHGSLSLFNSAVAGQPLVSANQPMLMDSGVLLNRVVATLLYAVRVEPVHKVAVTCVSAPIPIVDDELGPATLHARVTIVGDRTTREFTYDPMAFAVTPCDNHKHVVWSGHEPNEHRIQLGASLGEELGDWFKHILGEPIPPNELTFSELVKGYQKMFNYSVVIGESQRAVAEDDGRVIDRNDLPDGAFFRGGNEPITKEAIERLVDLLNDLAEKWLKGDGDES